jgi:hypothetical protein
MNVYVTSHNLLLLSILLGEIKSLSHKVARFTLSVVHSIRKNKV